MPDPPDAPDAPDAPDPDRRVLEYRAPDRAPDAEFDPDPGVPKIAGQWVVAMVLIWPPLIYLLFYLLTR